MLLGRERGKTFEYKDKIKNEITKIGPKDHVTIYRHDCRL